MTYLQYSWCLKKKPVNLFPFFMYLKKKKKKALTTNR